MKAFKNTLAAKYDTLDVVYIVAKTNPNKDYFIECTMEEIDWAVNSGAVCKAYKNTYTKAHANFR